MGPLSYLSRMSYASCLSYGNSAEALFMAQRKQASFSELRVGILVLSALGILTLVIFAVSGDIKLPGFSTTTTVKTQMANVDGLRKGAEVRLSGKKVGSVTGINFGKIPSSPDSPNNIEIVM